MFFINISTLVAILEFVLPLAERGTHVRCVRAQASHLACPRSGCEHVGRVGWSLKAVAVEPHDSRAFPAQAVNVDSGNDSAACRFEGGG